MKPRTIAAIILIVLGVAALAHQGISYATRGPDVEYGTARMSIETTFDLLLPPILGVLALIGGIGLLLVDEQDVKRVATP